MTKIKGIPLIGYSGAGKGTCYDSINQYPQVYQFSTGDMFRYLLKAENNELSKYLKHTLDTKGFIDDECTFNCMNPFLEQILLGGGNSFVDNILHGRIFSPKTDFMFFDGIPRRPTQAKRLDIEQDIPLAIYINTPRKESEKRLIQRARDEYDTNSKKRTKRLDCFRDEGMPIIDEEYYGDRLVIVNGNKGILEMQAEFLAKLKNHKIIQ